MGEYSKNILERADRAFAGGSKKLGNVLYLDDWLVFLARLNCRLRHAYGLLDVRDSAIDRQIFLLEYSRQRLRSLYQTRK